MIVDLILLAVIFGAFYGGFKAGNTYKTFDEMFAAWKAKL